MTDWMFQKKLDRSEILCAYSSPIAEATDGGLKFFVELIAKSNCFVLMSLAFAHQQLHMMCAVSLTDAWAVVLLVTPGLVLV